ncbi:Hsp70 family protein [Pseudonocardia sp.]|uniref:Hsp70 family protein n=1 Tax=Pseudonocardia sp. TaxID=60912 RepID=UPI0026133F79|nr:Hsp70 family protein [Pseudonocardia sp.]
MDLGTTWSAAAVCRPSAVAPEPVTLGEHAHAVASAVYAGGDGSFLLGEAAERRALSDPDRVIREFKRRIGDPTPVLVGREPVPAEVLAARFIATVVRQVSAREGAPPSRIAVTHPAGWGPHKVAALRAALAGQGVGPVVLLSEPQAAAVGYAATEKVEPGSVVAVFDLGGGTFDAAVVRKGADGRFELLGTPEGLERLGGVDFDEAVFAHVRSVLGPAWEQLDGRDPAVLAAVARLRRECTAAKEALSVDTVVHVPVMLPGLHTRVRLGRADFEDMIRPAVVETVDAMRRAIDSAGVEPSEVRLLLVGGSSRTPLVAELVSAGIERPASVDVDPKGVIAAGAALVAREADGPARAPGAAVLAAHGAGSVDPAERRLRPVPTGPFEKAAPGAAASAGAGAAAAAAAGGAAAAGSGAGAGGAAGGGAAGGGAPAGGAAAGGVAAGGGAGGGAAGGPRGGAAVGPGNPGAGGAPGRVGGAGPARPGGPTAVIRPSTQARPFSGSTARPGLPRTVLAAVAAGVVAAAALGGAFALAGRPSSGAEASEPGPVVVTTSDIPVTSAPVEPGTRGPQPEQPPAPRETRTPVETEPTTTEPTTTEPTTEPTTTEPTTTEPTTEPEPDPGDNPTEGEPDVPDPVVPEEPDVPPAPEGGAESEPAPGEV